MLQSLVITNMLHSVCQSAVAGTVLAKLPVTDDDSEDRGRVSWRLVNQDANTPFNLSADDGLLSVASALDRETVPEYSVCASIIYTCGEKILSP